MRLIRGRQSAAGVPKAAPKANRFGAKAPNHYSKTGAIDLAVRLYGYWAERGYPNAQFWVEVMPGTEIYCIRSNLIKGTPPIGKQ
jgi:hypothetical protein